MDVFGLQRGSRGPDASAQRNHPRGQCQLWTGQFPFVKRRYVYMSLADLGNSDSFLMTQLLTIGRRAKFGSPNAPTSWSTTPTRQLVRPCKSQAVHASRGSRPLADRMPPAQVPKQNRRAVGRLLFRYSKSPTRTNSTISRFVGSWPVLQRHHAFDLPRITGPQPDSGPTATSSGQLPSDAPVSASSHSSAS